MSFAKITAKSFFLILILLNVIMRPVWACTGIELKAKDGSYVNGRTVEFGQVIDFAGMVIPRNYEFKSMMQDNTPGLIYRAKYAVMGGGPVGTSTVMDGMNEKGLSVGAFYFPGFAGYSTLTPENKKMAIVPQDFVNWLLTQFASVEEIKAGLNSVVIVPVSSALWGPTPPFHYVVYEQSGKSIVIEPIDGQLKVYDNPLGVITNSPGFDWHLLNLANYINLSPVNAAPVVIDGMKLQQFGQGSGLHGLPGDFSPPSRFVRAAVFSSSAVPTDNAPQAVLQAFHILNQFDIPIGAVRAKANNITETDFTLLTSVKDPQNLKYYFKTYNDQAIKVINLKSFDLNAKAIKMLNLNSAQTVIDISANLK